MTFNIDAVKTLSKVLPFTEEKKQKFIEASESIIDFRNFISEKYIISAKDAESKINQDVKKYNSNILDSNQAAEASFNYATEEGYTKPEELKNSILYLAITLQNFASNFQN